MLAATRVDDDLLVAVDAAQERFELTLEPGAPEHVALAIARVLERRKFVPAHLTNVAGDVGGRLAFGVVPFVLRRRGVLLPLRLLHDRPAAGDDRTVLVDDLAARSRARERAVEVVQRGQGELVALGHLVVGFDPFRRTAKIIIV